MADLTDHVDFPLQETELLIDGPVGQLQLIATPPVGLDESQQPQAVAIICHPHSLMGGSMKNKVVHTLARAHRDAGHAAVRFNFRGVDKSEGEYSEGIGETDDLETVVRWVKGCFPEAKLWLAGFSFGSFVAAKSCRKLAKQGISCEQLTLIAPAVKNYPFSELVEFPAPLVVVYGSADEVVDPDAIGAWIKSVTTPKQSVCLAGAGHFFHGRLTELKSHVEALSFKS